MMTNDNKDETLIYWTVCVINIIILKVIFGLGKLASASASWFWPRPRPRPRKFVLGLGLGLGDLSSASASASRICPHLTSLPITHPSINRARCRETSLIETSVLTTIIGLHLCVLIISWPILVCMGTQSHPPIMVSLCK